MKLYGLIPARGNSKGIPRKNLALVGGKSLLQRAAEAAAGSAALRRTYLSTDSPEIAEAGKAVGLNVPFLRPPAIAGDATPMIDVLQHFLGWLEKNEDAKPDGIVLLQPTSPFRTGRHIDEAVGVWKDHAADTVVSVIRVPHQFHPDSVQRMGSDGSLSAWNTASGGVLRRQDKPPVYARNGPAVLVLSADMIRKGSFYGGRTFSYLMTEEDSLDIDGPADLRMAEFLALNRGQ